MEQARMTGLQDQLQAHSRSEGARYGAMHEELVRAGVPSEQATQIVIAKLIAGEANAGLGVLLKRAMDAGLWGRK